VQTPAIERNGVLSPDGRWLAYEADDSGSFEVYVRPYPDVSSGRWQVSTAGGTRPLWSRDGRELFYISPTGALMQSGAVRGVTWAATRPSTLLDSPMIWTGVSARTYDIAPDGQRFLVIKDAAVPQGTVRSGGRLAPAQIVVIQHFDELLKRLVPVN
jgi:serine/threonine-protein kinase